MPPIPFKIGDSYRPIDVTMPTSAVINTFDPTTGQAITVPNAVTNYGWEYVWHCHMLSHEEMDFMRPMVLSATPAAATNLAFVQASTAPRVHHALLAEQRQNAPSPL